MTIYLVVKSIINIASIDSSEGTATYLNHPDLTYIINIIIILYFKYNNLYLIIEIFNYLDPADAMGLLNPEAEGLKYIYLRNTHFNFITVKFKLKKIFKRKKNFI